MVETEKIANKRDNTSKVLTQEEISYLKEFFKNDIEEGLLYVDSDDIITFKKKLGKKIEKKEEYIEKRKEITNIIKNIYPKMKICNEYCIYDNEKKTVIEIRDISSYIDEIKKIQKANEISFFRGQSNFKWLPIPSLFRKEGYYKNENLLLYKMLRYNPIEFSSLNKFDVIAKMQHYGLPTRFLDITENPLVALYFACQGHNESSKADSSDGRVFLYSIDEKSVKYSNQQEVVELAEDIFDKKEKQNEKKNNFWFVRANFANERISRQAGGFIVPLELPASETAVKSVKIANELKTTFLIDRSSKSKILQDLKSLNIYEATMFAEMDKVADFICKEIKK